MWTCKKGIKMKHITNDIFQSYTELWKSIFGETYKDKYQHAGSGLSGGGGDYPFYDIHLAEDVFLTPEYRFCLGSSVELFNVPNDWYLRTGNKSTLARMGIDASFNTYIDNGFKGHLTIEIVNNTGSSIELKKGQPILKVEAVKCAFPAIPYNGKYQHQPSGAVGARFE